MKLTVLGAGAWGTALAARAAQRHTTTLWARDAAQAERLRATHENGRYLPGVALPAALRIVSDFDAAIASADEEAGGLVIVATPMAALREMLQRLASRLAPRTGVLWLCKGFEQGSGLLGHEIAREVAPGLRVGVLSGPSFALEVARAQPTALVCASADAALCEAAVAALHGESLRIYTSSDAVGVEVGGAVKNVLAIATGIADGMPASPGGPEGLGLNARAALITRGLAEMTRLGVALGARADTFMGLSGLGDLVLTATGDLSRNRSVGRLLAQGLALPRILAELGHVAEGVLTAPVVLQRAAALGVEMPIAHAVVEVLQGRLTPARALEQLMGRQSTSESAAENLSASNDKETP
jgi:glycerol-3-phosphate dehydrogenase (NAD(P)+)